MSQITAYSSRDIAMRDRLEDYAVDMIINTAGGLNLQIALVCDGAGGGDLGETASRLTARTILDYIEISNEVSIPHLLIQAVEEANRVVYSEVRGEGTSTVALIAIDLDDPNPYGRMYIASVGDSHIYLMRNGEMVRLNIDHTLSNEYVYAGQMSYAEARRLENAEYPTRVIGIGPTVQVDIGFYAERGRDFVNAMRAFNIGKHGMLLQEGDTIFAATDGFFRENSVDGRPYVRREEFLRHALDDNVERAANALLRYASSRRPDDNTSISMIFVPSRFRKAVRLGAGLSRRQRTGLFVLATLAVFIIGILGVQILRAESDRSALAEAEANIAQLILQLSYTPTATNTPTPTSTPTFTPTPTLRPTAAAVNEVGVQFFKEAQPVPVVLNRLVPANEISYAVIEGANVRQNADASNNPSNLFMQPNTQLLLSGVNDSPGSERIDMMINPLGDVYTYSADFRNGGVSTTLQQNWQIGFYSRGLCQAAEQIPPDITDPNDTAKVAFSCITGRDGECSYKLPNVPAVEFSAGQQVVIDVDKLEVVDVVGFPYDDARRYYDTVFELTGAVDKVRCLAPFLDIDGDTVSYPRDECENEAGSPQAAGCPDSDNDTIRDLDDVCPFEFGLPELQGCPAATETPLPDFDADGLDDVIDRCPVVPGPPENEGCPLATPTPVGGYGQAPSAESFVLRELQREESAHETGMQVGFVMMLTFAGVMGLASLRRRKEDE